MKKLLFILIIPILLCSCVEIKAPEMVFQKYEVSNIQMSKADINFIFDVENPNDIPIGINVIEYSLLLDGNHMLLGTSEGFSIKAKDKTQVKFPVEIKYAELAGQAANIAKKFLTKEPIDYKMDGKLSVNNYIGSSVDVPFEAAGKIEF
jgi:LEA14-like dessication related protein